MMTYDELLRFLKLRYPKFKIEDKSTSSLMKIINVILMIISFGQIKDFMTGFITTIGYTVYVPTGWDQRSDVQKVLDITHESTHIAQHDREGLLYYVKYLVWPVPVLFAKSRRDYELEAYTSLPRLGYIAKDSKEYEDFVVDTLSGSSYFWAWINKEQLRQAYRSWLK